MADHSSFPDSDDGLIEKTVESVTLHEGKFLTVKCDTVELPDGKHATREFVEHPGAVMILPLFDDGRVLLERQFRYPIGKVLVEFPAGKIDPNEDELTCAKRELQEETGYEAREWFFLTRIHPVISYSTEFIDLYLARGLIEGERKLDDGEFLETFIADQTQLADWVKSGRISDVKTIIGVFWLEKILSGEWKLGDPIGG
ncbi:MutT/NUDIX NTP pyrophosphatase [Caballeronia arationis]|jgi:ADP-ribose pyrophosphatase|uniref:GDP-mannose pyrophosphatase n=1 Tax=Caballeronia arationis TaxID=1777142 RepID=A0A7Z7I9T0_9BURK|nr:NUDIX hydrolase [Caballeronia arationis]SAK73593.1 MutT/NUDIX NTP pyrophosphatase [Caballeronia arationis]SOE81230.1 8-oxo-dGTP pyrophosphatase MutT, NUDIX family [Caballeronia arationis]